MSELACLRTEQCDEEGCHVRSTRRQFARVGSLLGRRGGEIAKYQRVVLHSMTLTNCKPVPTLSVAGSFKQKLDDGVDLDMQECRLYRGIVGSLQNLSRDKHLRKRDEATDNSFMDTTEPVSSVLGGNPVSESCTHETWNRLPPTRGILASLVGH